MSEALLGLQDNHDADVCLLLWAVWLGTRGRRVAPATASAAADHVAAWRWQVVRPLREVRRWLKDAAGTVPLPPDADILRTEVKALELAAERAQLALLAALTGEPAAGLEGRDLCHGNLAAALTAGGVAASDGVDLLDCVARWAAASPSGERNPSVTEQIPGEPGRAC